MKVIGLLGGMSWESSIEYYRLVNERVKAVLGGFHSAHTVLYSVDFAAIERMQAGGRWDDAGAELNRAAKALEAAGADFVVLCTNTMHKVADRLEDGLGIPLLHLGDATAAAVKAAGIRRVGLLGTGFTMGQPFYRDRLAAHGLDVLVPGAEDRDLVHRVIYDELVLGVVKPESREAYRAVIARLVDAGAEGVIYGCTEIELLMTSVGGSGWQSPRPGAEPRLSQTSAGGSGWQSPRPGAEPRLSQPEDSPVPAFPTTRLHADAAVAYALGKTPLPAPPV